MESNVLSELASLCAAVTDPEDARKLADALKHMTEALACELWLDETHLARKHGEKVFHENKETVHKLCELIKSTTSSIPDALLQEFIDRLCGADRLLASVAIQDACTAGASNKKIEQARKELAKGDAESIDDKCGNGFEHYMNAWKHCVRAKVYLLGDRPVQLEVLGEPGERLLLQVSSNLLDWVSLGTATADADGVATFTDPSGNQSATRYYRVLSP